MEIVYLTDIHDGIHELKTVLQKTEADLYLLSGDIIYKAFFNLDRIIEFCTLQEEMYMNSSDSKEEITPYDLATRRVRFPEKYTAEQVEKATLYRHLFQLASKTMKDKYELIEKLVQKYAHAKVISLPGNYDIDLQYTALYERDIHRKTFEIGDFRFSGYGGAPIATSGIPEKLAVKFHEYMKNGQNYSEPEEFFRQEQPEVVVIHNPAYGFLDRIPGYGNVGSQGIRRYLDDYEPLLVVSGHVHEDQGIVKKGNTVFLNPSNFGAVDSIAGFQQGGYFARIKLEKDGVKEVILNRLIDGNVVQYLDLDCSGQYIQTISESPKSDVLAENFVRK